MSIKIYVKYVKNNRDFHTTKLNLPTGNLDPENSWEIMKLLEKVNEQGTTVIVVTHNMEIVKAMNKRVITMKKGVKVEDSKGEEQTDEY